MMLLDQTVLIVGGTAGIGLAVAEAVADAGGRPIVASRRAERVSAAVRQLGANARGEVVDVCDEASIQALLARVGPIDHLVATPFFEHAATPVTGTDAATVDGLFRTKFLGQYLLAKHAAAHLSPRGSITFTSGVLSQRPAAGWAALAAMNAGLEALGRTLALELAPRRVNTISPGIVDTGKRFAGLPEAERAEKLQTAIGAKLPVGRVGQPADLAHAYLFVLQNPFLTGQTIVVDGGATVA